MQDLAMIDGDLTVNEFGDLSITATDNDDIIQMANNNIMTILGENMYHPDLGNDAHNHRLKITVSGLTDVESYSKDAILYDTRVRDVTSISASRGIEYGECVVSYSLVTTDDERLDGRVSINIY